MDKVNKDLYNLANTLEAENIVVHRTNILDQSSFFRNSFWRSNSNICHKVKDLNIVLGNKLIESNLD